MNPTAKAKARFLSHFEGVQGGRLFLTTPEGQRFCFGDDGGGAPVEFHLKNWSLLSGVRLRGTLALGEGYRAGLWESETLEDLLHLLSRNFETPKSDIKSSIFTRHREGFLRPQRAQRLHASERIGNEFYQLWLDRGMTYSSGIFGEGDDLEAAQILKNKRILSQLSTSERILEIGCGWGAFAEIAADEGCFVTGLATSQDQAGYALARLDGRADIRLQDPRALRKKFDNIVSIETPALRGEKAWLQHFQTLHTCLEKEGKIVLQAVVLPEGLTALDQERALRQDGLLSREGITRLAQKAQLNLQGQFSFGQDYARTCRIWGERMQEAASRLKRLGYDDAFIRSWRYEFHRSAADFALARKDVVQLELMAQR